MGYEVGGLETGHEPTWASPLTSELVSSKGNRSSEEHSLYLGPEIELDIPR